MAVWKIRQTVDLSKPLQQNVLKANMPHMLKGSEGAYEWIVTVLDNGAYVDLSEYTLYGHYYEANGGGLINAKPGEIKNNVCTVPLVELTAPGLMRGALKLTKSGVEMTIAVGEFYVHEGLG